MRLGRTFLCALLISMVFVVVAWPGAATRGVIAEEVQPYLLRYPRLIDHSPNGVVMLPPNDAPSVTRFVGSEQWPELGYNGKNRVYPLFVRGHQTALGTWFGILLQPVLGGGIAGVRRSSVLMALSLVLLTFGLARRLGLSLAWSTAAALGLALSPGFWFFARTGYAFELASRVLMGACLFVAAPLAKIDRRRGIAIAIFFGLAILARATIATTMAPALLLMLFHPKRDPGRKSVVGIIGLAGAIPIVTVAIALLTLPFGTAPAQNLRVAMLAKRTLVAPATALVQLAWVTDARVILRPLIEGDAKLHGVAPLLAIIGCVSAIAALARWWNARATEGERIFIAALLGNALFGAWMYGNPGQFQLGLGLEPLFVIAVAGQLAAIPRYSWVFAVGLLGARVGTLASIAAIERRTQNPMLDGKAQRDVVALLEAKKIPADDLITTTYDHVGVIEAWTDERYRPVHAWRILRVSGFPEERVVESWKRIFAAHPACHVLLTTAPNLVAGSFTDNALVARALERVATERGQELVRTPVKSAWGREIFQLVELRGCKAP